MASSNRHWPSMFKSKPCNSHHQWQHDINPCSHQKTPYSAGFEERSPEPKPRWNPKPEQIRILEAIFNSGMVNPPRDEIRKIRAQLQEYGQVGDANVFYWFQNRKSRSKNKQRHLQSARSLPEPPPPSSAAASAPPAPATAKPPLAAATSSSSSSEQSTGSDKALHPVVVQSPAVLPPVLLHGPLDLGGEAFTLQGSQGYCFSASDVAGILGAAAPEQTLGFYPGLWGEVTGVGQETKVKMQLHQLYGIGAAAAAPGASAASATVTGVNASPVGAGVGVGVGVGSPISEIQAAAAMGVVGAPRSTVFINEVVFEVAAGLLNVREAFGGEAILVDHSGQPVLTDEWGFTIHPLQHGASYYLV